MDFVQTKDQEVYFPATRYQDFKFYSKDRRFYVWNMQMHSIVMNASRKQILRKVYCFKHKKLHILLYFFLSLSNSLKNSKLFKLIFCLSFSYFIKFFKYLFSGTFENSYIHYENLLIRDWIIIVVILKWFSCILAFRTQRCTS